MSEPLRAQPLRLVDEEAGYELRDIAQARAGDVRAWARLYKAHFRPLLRHAAYLCGDAAVAEDLVQEAFALALARLSTYDERASFRTWMRGVVMNLVRKTWRKGARRQRAHARLEQVRGQLDQMLQADPQAELTQLLTRDRRAKILSASLEQLPINLREAFILSDVQGLGASEGAELLGISPGNFRVRASRARARLKAQFQELGVLEGDGG